MYSLRLFRWDTAVPIQHRRNFTHLFFDIAWFGVLNGSFVTFASVYLTRVGATSFQLGLFTAAPALGALLFSLPLGAWLNGKRVDRTVFYASVVFRALYLLWLPLPVLFNDKAQVILAIGLTFLFSGPGTLLAIGFNALLADTVPPQWRNSVVGIRQGLLAATSILTTLLCGALLERVVFPLNYQIVFGIGAAGALLSSAHLWFIRTEHPQPRLYRSKKELLEYSNPGLFGGDRGIRPPISMRYFLHRPILRLPDVEILRGEYGRVLVIVLFFFLALYIPNPIYHPYWVSELRYSDQLIGIGTAAFYVCQLAGSLQLNRLTGTLGNPRVFAVGAMFLGAYPGLTALFPHPVGFIVASTVAGLAWGVAGGALLTYVLAAVPIERRASYMAWYSLLTNIAILLAAFIGPQIAAWVGLRGALGAAGLLRFSAGLVIWFFGRQSEKKGRGPATL